MNEVVKKAIVIIKSHGVGKSEVGVEFKGQIWSRQEIFAAHKAMDLEQRKIRSAIRRKDDKKRKEDEAAILATEEKDEKDHFKNIANDLFGDSPEGGTDTEVEESEELLEIEFITDLPKDEEIPDIPEIVSRSSEGVTEVQLGPKEGPKTNDKEIGEDGRE
jgi:hypothetical protein